jgi:succinyl-CoA synthetase beta subunit
VAVPGALFAGGTLVTKQTGPLGKPVNTLYVAKKMKLAREMYFAILLDRKVMTLQGQGQGSLVSGMQGV